MSTSIILDWYSYVSLFPDLWCNIGLSVSGLRKMRFNAYTRRGISTKKSVPKQTSIPIIRVDNFNLVSISFSVPWFIVSSVWVSAVYAKYVSTPIHSVFFSTKKSVPKQTRIPVVQVNNFRFIWYPFVSLFPDLLCYRFECQRFTQNTFQRLYTPSNFHNKSVHKRT